MVDKVDSFNLEETAITEAYLESTFSPVGNVFISHFHNHQWIIGLDLGWDKQSTQVGILWNSANVVWQRWGREQWWKLH